MVWHRYLYVFLPLVTLLVYALGFLHGHIIGRRAECRNWKNEVAPKLRQMREERDALWRSAVAKTQKLNRLRRKEG